MSNSVLQKFFEDGFVVLRSVFNPMEVETISNSLNQLKSTAKNFRTPTLYKNSYFVVEDERIHRIVWCCGEVPALADFARDYRITQHVAEILGSKDFDHIICQSHYKTPGDNVAFDWHQDSQHRGYGTDKWQDLNNKGSFVQTLLAIDPMTMENGPIKFYKGSQKLKHLGLDKCEDPEKYFSRFELVHLTMEPGDLAFFHPYVIHGSSANNSTKERRVFINGFSFPNANKFSYPGAGTGVRISVP